MKKDLRQQKQEARAAERAQRNVTIFSVSVAALLVLALAMVSLAQNGRSATPQASPAAESFRRIEIKELKSLFDRNALAIIDVRDADSYLKAHIPGAIHIPLSRLEGEVDYLPKGKLIVAYCTCPAEESSGYAVQILNRRGIADAAALRGGLAAWIGAGYKVDSGAAPRN